MCSINRASVSRVHWIEARTRQGKDKRTRRSVSLQRRNSQRCLGYARSANGRIRRGDHDKSGRGTGHDGASPSGAKIRDVSATLDMTEERPGMVEGLREL